MNPHTRTVFLDTRSPYVKLWSALLRRRPLPIALCAMALVLTAPAFAQSNGAVDYGANGLLSYVADARLKGDTIIDFSTAGYNGGATQIPTVAMVGSVINPSGGDDTAIIQGAINNAQNATLGSNGFRGAVVLGTGTFNISATLRISASGVVLRGAGTSTVLNMVKNVSNGKTINFPAVTITGSGSPALTGTVATITDTYAAAGLTRFNVYPHNLFTVGEKVMVRRPATDAWVTFLKMDRYNTDNPPWLCTSTSTQSNCHGAQESDYERTVVAQDEYTVTLDTGIPDSFDSTYVSGYIQPFTYAGRITNCGVENMEIVAPAGYQPIETDANNQPFQAVWLDALQNGWVRNVTAVNTFNSFWMNSQVNQTTLTGITITQNVPQPPNSPTFTHFALQGGVGRIMIENVTLGGSQSINTYGLETQTLSVGPNVFRSSHLTMSGDVGGHQRWSTGLLDDNIVLTDVHVPNPGSGNDYTSGYAGFSARDAGNEGIDHGWASAWTVIWNSTAEPGPGSPGHEFIVEMPPGADNYCVGCIGDSAVTLSPGQTSLPAPTLGQDLSHGTFVLPQSLWAAQLLERVSMFKIYNVMSGKALSEDNNAMDQHTYGSQSQNDHYTAVSLGKGLYLLQEQLTGRMVSLPNGNSGTQAVTVACTSPCSANEQFTLNPGADGNFVIANLHFSRVLNVADGNAGTPVTGQAVSAGAASQEWNFYTP